ncbi:hypothetical protein KM043_008577 [Ampulex compressa]|nr:hypothetical protein KM043_008577 [Ampulex compressa]
MVIGFLLGPVTRFERSPRPRGFALGRGEGEKIDLTVRREVERNLDPRESPECSRIWRKIVTATRIYPRERRGWDRGRYFGLDDSAILRAAVNAIEASPRSSWTISPGCSIVSLGTIERRGEARPPARYALLPLEL